MSKPDSEPRFGPDPDPFDQALGEIVRMANEIGGSTTHINDIPKAVEQGVLVSEAGQVPAEPIDFPKLLFDQERGLHYPDGRLIAPTILLSSER